jgi:hypothetical protein
MAKKQTKPNPADKLKNMKFKIVVIGAGGTGSYFLKEFSRFVSGTDYLYKISGMYIFDGDHVEESNLKRQCFLKEDIGAGKATIMAEILNDSFELNWKAFPEYVTNVEQLVSKIELSKNEMPILIGCVDNHGCRMVLEDLFRLWPNCVYFDSANEFESGEVVLSYRFLDRQLSKLRTEIFPDVLKGDLRNVTEMSCEELNVSSPQHITVNMMAGLVLLSSLSSFLNDYKVTPGFVSFNARTLSSDFYPAPSE